MKSPIVIDLAFATQVPPGIFQNAFPDRDVINISDPGNRERDLTGVPYALIWKQAPDFFRRATDLKAIFSGGAGVDHILGAGDLPADVPLVRFVDPSLTNRMSEWVVMQCLLHLRQHYRYQQFQRESRWQELPQPEAKEATVGIMGLGELGRDAAYKLKVMGFNVVGWSRTKKAIDGIETYDHSGLDAFLAQTDILVGLLPLTTETRGIFNARLFAKLRSEGPLGKPVFINAGRGGSQVENSIATALKIGILGGASLDVFEVEPLPKKSSLWNLPNVFITPHAAAVSDIKALLAHVARQIARFEAGEPLQYVVDRQRGY